LKKLLPSPSPKKTSNSETVARNSLWYGIEMMFNLGAAFIVSALVARAMGPERLGPFNFVVLLTSLTTTVGGFGLPMTTRKYMAERLNAGHAAEARAIYRFALRLQLVIAAVVMIAGVAVAILYAGEDLRRISVILAVAMGPRMIGFIPSQANSAAEMMRWNTKPALIGGVVAVTLTLLSLAAGWGLLGVAASTTLGASLESFLKFRSVEGWLERSSAPLSADMRKRLFSYSGQGVVLMLLNVIVWDRSDMIILEWLNPDVRQLAFFSLSFSLTDRLLKLPEALGNALGVSLMAQYGRGRERLPLLTSAGAKYAFLLAVPLLLGVACMSRPLVLLVYGEKYRPLIPVLAVATCLAIPRAMTPLGTALLQTLEQQGYLIWTGCICGALDIALDIWLTPIHGALGAALANGIAQTAAATAIWVRVHRLFPMTKLFRSMASIAFCGAAMAGVASAVSYVVPGRAGIAVSVLAGAIVWFVLLPLTGAFDRDDRDRFLQAAKAIPAPLRPLFDRMIMLLAYRATAARA
jgi:O-antigen/teichoic acid export membrane protein